MLLRRLSGLALLAIAALAVATFLWSLTLISTTFAGFRVLSDLRISDVILSSWTGASADLPFLRHLRTINGQPVASAAAFNAMVGALPVGTPVTYGIEGASGGLNQVTIATQRFGTYDWVGSYFIF